MEASIFRIPLLTINQELSFYQKKDEIIFTLPGWLMVAPCMGSVNDSIVYGFRTVLTIPSTLTD